MVDQELLLEADLLHPLATLHWERCPSWDGIITWNYAVLHDLVCVQIPKWKIQQKGPSHDMLTVFSTTDLHSQTTITLPCQHMALTTYQSKFVAVGGSHRGTHEVTNKLWTSDTGKNWQPSPLLPPMPTNRHSATALSIGSSPQYLVVAGGQDSENMPLNEVEVLVGEQWNTVDPFPKQCNASQLTLHDENLYFVGRTLVGYSIFTCKCNSLILSCGDANNNSPTSGALWSKFKAPSATTGIVSYGQRLISIGRHSTIRAYSSMSQSWMESTSEGNGIEVIDNTAAVVHLTRELMVCCEDGRAYRVTLSVSTFDPDSKFISGVLLRLEAVMGIQIVSALAKVYSEVATRAGLQLKGVRLPDPQEEPSNYVNEVISLWSAGHSHLPPTWRELLDVLQDVGLLELSQQIEAYMEGKEKYVDDYLHYLNTRESLDLLFLKFIFLGPPRLGKTTARRHLTGEIADLMTAGEAEQPHPSTGTVESGLNMVVRSLSDTTAVITESEWTAVENLEDKARMLFHNLVDIIDRKKKVSPSASPRSSGDLVQTVDESTASQSSVVPRQRGNMPVQESRPDFPSPVATSQPRNILQFTTFFKEAIVSEYWEDVKHMFKDKFKAYLRMEDTGGQPELMDMLPALTVGPALYLLFLNLEHELQSRYEVSYCSKEGENSIPVESTYTVEERFLSALSSIACSTTSGISSEEATNPEMIKILESSKSVVYIVGTHKDNVSEQHIVDFDKKLQTIIRSTDFFEKGTVRFWSENKLVMAMNNMTGGTEEIDEIRKLLGEGMEKHFNKLKIPVVWLLFSLCLCITAEQDSRRTADVKSCFSLSSQFGMSRDETKVALWFLYHHAGVVMYFPDVDELKDFVILDNQIVYDSVTFVILEAMKFEGVGEAAAEKFKDTGQFLLDDLTKATSEVSRDHIPPLKLVALLDFLHIIARILPTPASQPSSVTSAAKDNSVYIMPCVLNSASTEELDCYCKNATTNISAAPIMVRYTCGFVPMGVFPAFIVCLIADKSFDLIQKGIKKNKVQFNYGEDRSLVTFISRPKYYEIHIVREATAETPLEEECVAIRKKLESTFEKVSSRMNYGCFMDYQFSFECTADHTESKSKHLGVVKREENSPRRMDCLSDRERGNSGPLKNCHLVWYGKQSTNTQVSSSCPPFSSAPPPSTLPSEAVHERTSVKQVTASAKSPPSSFGTTSTCPSPPNPPVNQTTLADVQLPLTYGPVKSVLRKRTGESSQAQESVCVHDGRTSVEQVTNYNSIGSESSKPSLPKTRNTSKIGIQEIVVILAMAGVLFSLFGLVFIIAGFKRDSHVFIGTGGTALANGAALIIGVIFFVILRHVY